MCEAERKLWRYGELKRLIQAKARELREVHEEKNAFMEWQLKAPALDRVRVQGGEGRDPVFDTVWKMLDVFGGRAERIRAALAALWWEHDGIVCEMDAAGLSEEERGFIRWRYVERMKMPVIAQRMQYSERQAFRIQGSVLGKMGERASG